MTTPVKVIAIVAALALSAVPAIASADKPNDNGPQYETPHEKPTPGPRAGLPAKAKAYGRYCKGESKKHVKGEKGTPYSQCVKAGAKLRA